ncbi:MAG: hypothetical protein HY287_14465 [Planctomycetes bacterium]|nr:hypothetical protein [Planctomycetota bacterium]MBI3835526.1 hypothetical protein [Planctomycetota bacterium]
MHATVLYGRPGTNTSCKDAVHVSGEGLFAFDSRDISNSTIHPSCKAFGTASAKNLWFCWTATWTGEVTVDTCGGTLVDTQLVAFDSCSCDGAEIACNDDACGTQSSISFSVTEGNSYAILLGAGDVSGATGTFRIQAGVPQSAIRPCAKSNGDPCYGRASPIGDALNSTRGEFVVMDDFSIYTQTNTTYNLSQICWWGVNFDGTQECLRSSTDQFEVIYFNDDCGKPGSILAGPFRQSEGSLTVIGPWRTYRSLRSAQELEYSGSHAQFQVSSNVPYWVKISNSPSSSCSWYWEVSSPSGQSFQASAEQPDLFVPVGGNVFFDDVLQCSSSIPMLRFIDRGVCYPVPANDLCSNASELQAGATISFDTTKAGTDGPTNVPFVSDSGILENYFPLGDEQVYNDIWFRHHSNCDAILAANLCDSNFDTKVAIYDSFDCVTLPQPVSINDDACGPELEIQSLLRTTIKPGHDYLIRIGGYRRAIGLGEIKLSYQPPEGATLTQFAILSRCFTGPCAPTCDSGLVPIDPCCSASDYDADGDVDGIDLKGMIRSLVGP